MGGILAHVWDSPVGVTPKPLGSAAGPFLSMEPGCVGAERCGSVMTRSNRESRLSLCLAWGHTRLLETRTANDPRVDALETKSAEKVEAGDEWAPQAFREMQWQMNTRSQFDGRPTSAGRVLREGVWYETIFFCFWSSRLVCSPGSTWGGRKVLEGQKGTRTSSWQIGSWGSHDQCEPGRAEPDQQLR